MCATCIRKSKEIAMRTISRFIPIASCAAVAAMLAGCTVTRTVAYDRPVTTVATVPAVVTPAPVYVSPAPVIVAP